MRTPYIIGLDAGNSEANAVIGTGRHQRSMTIPSFIGSGSAAELARIRSGGGRSDEPLREGEYVLETGHQSWFVGDLALAQSLDADSQRGNESRYWSGHALRLLMVLAGSLIKDKSFTVRVVTGLPVQVWSEHNAGLVADSFNGNHTFTLNGVKRAMLVDGVTVIMEGAGALIAHGSADEVPQGVIDVGGKTTDLFYATGQEANMPRCGGTAWGVERVADAVNDMLRRNAKARPLSSQELRSVLRAYAAGQPLPTLYNNGEPMTLNGELRDALAVVGGQISSFVSQTWRPQMAAGRVAGDARTVLLVGGGAHYFARELRHLIPHLTVPADPELANARGYRELGEALDDDDWMR